MINYLAPKGFITGKNPGGMYVKVQQAKSVLESMYHTKLISEIRDGLNGILLVEPLWFRIGCEDEDPKTKLDQLKSATHLSKILYCSEAEVIRWTGKFRNSVLSLCAGVTANTKYQQGFLTALGVNNIHRLVDPINPYLYRMGYPSDPPLVVAGGLISDSKNAQRIIEVFGALKSKNVRTAYIGSAGTWGGHGNPTSQKLEMLMEQVTDDFYGNVSKEIVSHVFSQASVFVADSTHDTSAQMHCEAMFSGVVPVVGVHPVYQERPGIVGCRAVSDFVNGIGTVTNGFKTPPALEYRMAIREWAVSQYGYSAFQKQMTDLVSRYLPKVDDNEEDDS